MFICDLRYWGRDGWGEDGKEEEEECVASTWTKGHTISRAKGPADVEGRNDADLGTKNGGGKSYGNGT